MANRNVDDIIENMLKRFDHISDFIVKHQNQITESLNDAKNYVRSEIKNIYAKINNIELRVNELENRLDCVERDRLSNDVVISGVPVLKNENLIDIFNKICQTIAIKDFHTVAYYIFRPSNNNVRKHGLPIIVVKFINWMDKMKFFKAYIKFGNLNLSHVGLQATSRIYCNDGLTKLNSSIFNHAKNLQKQKILSKVTSKKGLTYVILPNQDTFVAIKSIAQLNKIAAENGFKLQDRHHDQLNDSNTTFTSAQEQNATPISSSLSELNVLPAPSTSSAFINIGSKNDYTNKNNSSTTSQPTVLLMTSQIDHCVNNIIEDCNSLISLPMSTTVRNLRPKSNRTNANLK